MVSFEEEDFLFTSVTIEGAIQAELYIRKLESNPGLSDRTTLTPVQIADLLDFVLRSKSFQYNGSIYEQQDSQAMGTGVSAVMLIFYMEVFDEQAIAAAFVNPRSGSAR